MVPTWLLERVPTLLGVDDDWTGVDVAAYPVLGRVLRSPSRDAAVRDRAGAGLAGPCGARAEGDRDGGARARGAFCCSGYGTPAPGPTPVPMRVPPSARVLLRRPDLGAGTALGVDIKRQRAIRAAATVADRLEECVRRRRPRCWPGCGVVPGIGEWTAAETAQRAFGHPDAVSVGDFHLANWVVHALTGRARGTDARCSSCSRRGPVSGSAWSG